jgi:predicted XRE-type DNA-binding protein
MDKRILGFGAGGEIASGSAIRQLSTVTRQGQECSLPGLISTSAPPRGRGAGLRHFRVRLPVAQQLLFLALPAVRRHVSSRERIIAIRVALQLIRCGKFSQNSAAALLGISQSALSKWLRRYDALGEAGLQEQRLTTQAAARQKTEGVICRLSFLKQ